MTAQSEAMKGGAKCDLQLEAPIGRLVDFKLKMDKTVVWGRLSCRGTKATVEIIPLNSRQAQKMTLESTGEQSMD
jgi:hypothetical protein